MVPGPTNVPPRVMKALQRPVINHRGPEFRELYKRILEGLKYAFQTKHEVFPLTCSGTGGVECAIGNVVSGGDKVIIPVNGLFSERMREEVLRFGGVPLEIPSQWGSVCSVEDVKAVLDANKDVKAIAVVYNETSTGAALRDLPEIGKMAKKEDKLLIVDAVSVLGGDYLPVDDWNVDICVTGSQKCLACPPGLAMVSVSSKAYGVVEEKKTRPFYFDLVSCRNFAKNLETPFTPVLPLFYTLEEALEMLKEEGLENRIRRHKACAGAFYAALEEMTVTTVSSGATRSNTVIAAYLPPGVEDKTFRSILREKHGVVIGGGARKLKGKSFRVGSMGVISGLEVSATVDGILKTFKELGYGKDLRADEVVLKVRDALSGM